MPFAHRFACQQFILKKRVQGHALGTTGSRQMLEAITVSISRCLDMAPQGLDPNHQVDSSMQRQSVVLGSPSPGQQS